MTPPAIILVRPREEGNVGAVARAMANMGLGRLILVEPAPELAGVARGFGVGGWDVLDRVERAPSLVAAIADFGRVVATASLRQRPLRHHQVISPRRLPEILAEDPVGTETALVFGSESTGLGRRELDLCSPVVAIPSAQQHPTLNLSQAVLILAYELFVAPSSLGSHGGPSSIDTGEPQTLATAGQVDVLRHQVDDVLLGIGFDHAPIRSGLLRDLLRLVIQASPSDRDLRILRRLCNRVGSALGRRPTRRPAE